MARAYMRGVSTVDVAWLVGAAAGTPLVRWAGAGGAGSGQQQQLPVPLESFDQGHGVPFLEIGELI